VKRISNFLARRTSQSKLELPYVHSYVFECVERGCNMRARCCCLFKGAGYKYTQNMHIRCRATNPA
jgi:hypothetical protein